MSNERKDNTKKAKGWRHAFAVDRGRAQPNEAQRAVIERLASEIVRRHLTTPAIAFLEMSRPLNFIASQTMHFFHPIVQVITDAHGYRALAEFLEHRGSVDYLCSRIEALEAEATKREKAAPSPAKQDELKRDDHDGGTKPK